MNYDFRAITKDDIPLMTDLLVARQLLESETYPFLNNRCLNKKYITGKFQELFEDSKIIGFAAYNQNEFVGYLVGEIKGNNGASRYASVPYEGLAIREDQPLNLIKHLYAKVSLLWTQYGCFEHSVFVPLGSSVYYEAFIQLSFSIEQVHAVMSLARYTPFANVGNVAVRIANRDDREALGRMSGIIAEFHNDAPVFIPILPEELEKRNEGFKSLVDEEDIVLIAEKDNKEVGFHDYEAVSPDLMKPDEAAELCVAGTYASEMGKGIGKKLMNEGCKVLKEKRYEYIITDWRITNIASSSFWPKCGFNTVTYRMARTIDRDYAWANFSNPRIKGS